MFAISHVQVMTDPDITAIREGKPVTLRPRVEVLDSLAVSAQATAGSQGGLSGCVGRKRREMPLALPGAASAQAGVPAPPGGKLMKKARLARPDSAQTSVPARSFPVLQSDSFFSSRLQTQCCDATYRGRRALMAALGLCPLPRLHPQQSGLGG